MLPLPTMHRVAEGETLEEIALNYYPHGSHWTEIYDANKTLIGDNPGDITSGMVLIIPKPGVDPGDHLS